MFSTLHPDWLFIKLIICRLDEQTKKKKQKQKETLNSECVSWPKKLHLKSKKYSLWYKDYSTINNERVLIFKVKHCWLSFQNRLGLSESTRVFVQHNIGFIKYYNSRTNIYMPACFLTKMAAIGKNDGSEIEQNQTGVYINDGIGCLIALLHTQYL